MRMEEASGGTNERSDELSASASAIVGASAHYIIMMTIIVMYISDRELEGM